MDAINIVLADPAADAAAFARDVNARMPGVLARTDRRRRRRAAGPFLVLERFHLAIAAVTIVAATVFLLALTIMLVDERRETVGVLRLIGLPARRILVQICSKGCWWPAPGRRSGWSWPSRPKRCINRSSSGATTRRCSSSASRRGGAASASAIAVPLGAAATVVASWALLRRNGLRLVRR